jgi:hypothetical protein
MRAFAGSYDSNYKSLNWYLREAQNHLGHLCSRVFQGFVRHFFNQDADEIVKKKLQKK